MSHKIRTQDRDHTLYRSFNPDLSFLHLKASGTFKVFVGGLCVKAANETTHIYIYIFNSAFIVVKQTFWHFFVGCIKKEKWPSDMFTKEVWNASAGLNCFQRFGSPEDHAEEKDQLSEQTRRREHATANDWRHKKTNKQVLLWTLINGLVRVTQSTTWKITTQRRAAVLALEY